MFLSIKDLKKSFGEDEYKTEVLKGIDFEIEKGEICVLLGPSGSGKSTRENNFNIKRKRSNKLSSKSFGICFSNV